MVKGTNLQWYFYLMPYNLHIILAYIFFFFANSIGAPYGLLDGLI